MSLRFIIHTSPLLRRPIPFSDDSLQHTIAEFSLHLPSPALLQIVLICLGLLSGLVACRPMRFTTHFHPCLKKAISLLMKPS